LNRFATKEDLERFATKEDLAATRRELSERIAEVQRHADVRIEDARDDIRKVAESVAVLSGRVDGLSTDVRGVAFVLDTLVTRLEAKGVI
jgi:hypothetical protein